MASDGATLTLYHLPNGPARSVKPLVILEELGIPFTVHPINILAGEQKTPEFLALNPCGKIPVLKIEKAGEPTQVVIESGAIIYYLLDNYDPEHRLTGPVGSASRSLFHQIAAVSSWAEEPLGTAIGESFFKGGFEGEGKGDKAVYDAALNEFRTKVEPLLEHFLGDKQFFGGDKFGAADAFVGYICYFASLKAINALSSEKLKAYARRALESTGFSKALANVPEMFRPQI